MRTSSQLGLHIDLNLKLIPLYATAAFSSCANPGGIVHFTEGSQNLNLPPSSGLKRNLQRDPISLRLEPVARSRYTFGDWLKVTHVTTAYVYSVAAGGQ